VDVAILGSTVRTVSIVIVDDHPLVREGLARVIGHRDDFEVIGEADSIESALELDVSRVDVCTLDLSLPGIGGLEGMNALRERWPGVRFLVLTVHPEDSHAAACAQRGASGFLPKSASPDEIRTAIAGVADGGQYFSETALAAIVMQRDVTPLTTRELEVLRLLARGQRITDIARQLEVSVKTVSTHKMRLQRKLGASNTAQIAVMARQRGVLS
jgi:DNA-binding NarL/FixJ family response regulator